ncbi:MAG: hypothetical protein ACAI35_26900 [Candidatus Methylacidiphilales bacterium]|nr:hypothetical protein [Candidatus Methylacidiphilales bacterium]
MVEQGVAAWDAPFMILDENSGEEFRAPSLIGAAMRAVGNNGSFGTRENFEDYLPARLLKEKIAIQCAP